VAAIKGLYEMGESTKQRKAELRWRRANAARELITDIHRDPRASNAVLMMDWSEGTHEYQIEPGRKEVFSYKDVLSALRKAQADCLEPRERFIRDCFDWFFYYVDRIEHYIETGLIEFTDVESVFKSYGIKVKEHKEVYEPFIASRGYELITRFRQRYEAST